MAVSPWHSPGLNSPFRDAWDAANETSGDFLTAFPNPARMTFIGLGFDDCLAHYLGLELPSLRGSSVIGLRIPQIDRRDRPLQPKHVDAHGGALEVPLVGACPHALRAVLEGE